MSYCPNCRALVADGVPICPYCQFDLTLMPAPAPYYQQPAQSQVQPQPAYGTYQQEPQPQPYPQYQYQAQPQPQYAQPVPQPQPQYYGQPQPVPQVPAQATPQPKKTSMIMVIGVVAVIVIILVGVVAAAVVMRPKPSSNKDGTTDDNNNDNPPPTPPPSGPEPYITATEPKDKQTGVSTNPTFKITWNEPMNQIPDFYECLVVDPFTSGGFTGADSSYWVDSKTVVVEYTSGSLDPGTRFTASIRYVYLYEVKDLDGNYPLYVDENERVVLYWNFTTES